MRQGGYTPFRIKILTRRAAFFCLTPGQTYERVHLPGDPLILVVNNLTPGPHVEIPDIQYGQLSADNIPVYGEFRKKGNTQVLSQQVDDKFRVPYLQKGVYFPALAARYWSRIKR